MTSPYNIKLNKAYAFLCNKEKQKKTFSAQELALEVGWKEKTVKTYISKKWRVFLKKNKDKTFTVKGLHLYSEVSFRKLHSQALDTAEQFPEINTLLEKSKQFALIAVSNYNNPLFQFKTHSFITHIVISYLALFHAIFERTNVEYFYRDKQGKLEVIDNEYKAFELSKCCQVYWNGKNNAQVKNIEFLIGLRNKIEHRSLPAIDLYVEGECLAALINYENLLVKEFGEQHSLNSCMALSMQLSKVSEQNRNKAIKELQTENYKLIKNYVDNYREKLDDSILLSQEYRITVFLIPKIGNHAKSTDMCIEFIKKESLTEEELNQYEKGIALIKTKKNCYRFKPKKVMSLVMKKIQLPCEKKSLTSFHTKCWKYYNARPKEQNLQFEGKYSGWIEGYDGYLYNQAWVDFLITKLSDTNEYNQINQCKH